MDEVADGPSAPPRTDRRRLIRWLRVSVAVNMVLAGAVIGLVVSRLVGGAPLPLPPPDGAALQSVFDQALEQVVAGDRLDQARAVVAGHRDRFDDAVRAVAGEGDWPSARREEMSQAFVDGALTDAMAAEWQAMLTQVGQARWRFISAVFLDLSRVLDRDERAGLRDAMAVRARQIRACVE